MFGSEPLGAAGLGQALSGSGGNTINQGGAPFGAFNEVGYNHLTAAYQSVSTNTTVTPPTAALILATFAPQANQAIIVPVSARALATFAPTVGLSDNKLVVPPTPALALSSFAPVIGLTVTPGTAKVALVPYYMTFDSTDQITVPHNTVLSLSDNISAFVTIHTTGTGDRLINKWSTKGWLMDTGATGNLRVRIFDGTASLDYNTTAVNDGLWHTVGFTYTRGSATGLKLYVDGSQVGTSQDTTALTTAITNTSAVGLGNIPAAGGSQYQGDMDNVLIFGRVLTGTEIANYQTGTTPVDPVLHLAFDEGTGTTVYDKSGYDNHGTMFGTAFTPYGYTPSVTITNNQLATPATATAVLTTYAPSLVATDNKVAVPTTTALTLALFTPTVTATASLTATPSTPALALSFYAPVIGLSIIPPPGALSLSAPAPTVTASDFKLVTPPTTNLSLTRFAPTIGISNHKTATPPTATLVLSSFTPVVSSSQIFVPSLATLVAFGFAPTVQAATLWAPISTPTTGGFSPSGANGGGNWIVAAPTDSGSLGVPSGIGAGAWNAAAAPDEDTWIAHT